MAGAPVRLTRREFDVLAYLAARPDEAHSRAEILYRLWDDALRPRPAPSTCTSRASAPRPAGPTWCAPCTGSATSSAPGRAANRPPATGGA
ncbi:helix-turn-helix domain-containing protein [Streptomyces youssoufiensis]